MNATWGNISVVLDMSPSKPHIFHDAACLPPIVRHEVCTWHHNAQVRGMKQKHQLRMHAIHLAVHRWKTQSQVLHRPGLLLILTFL